MKSLPYACFFLQSESWLLSQKGIRPSAKPHGTMKNNFKSID